MKRLAYFLFFMFVGAAGFVHAEAGDSVARLNLSTSRFLHLHGELDLRMDEIRHHLEEFHRVTDSSRKKNLKKEIRQDTGEAQKLTEDVLAAAKRLTEALSAFKTESRHDDSKLTPPARLYAHLMNPERGITAEDVYRFERSLKIGTPFSWLSDTTPGPILVKVNTWGGAEFLILEREQPIRVSNVDGAVLNGRIKLISSGSRVVIEPLLPSGTPAGPPAWRVVPLNEMAKIEVVQKDGKSQVVWLRPGQESCTDLLTSPLPSLSR